jgi:hypothetical protein
MHVLQIEHQVEDFGTWKGLAFDADPLGRAGMSVRRHWIARATDDPNRLLIQLEFDSKTEAETMDAALRRLWSNPLVKIGVPTTRIAEIVEVREY